MPSRMLKCGDCGNMFDWSERDQKFYASKRYEPPKRCRSCRDKRKKSHAGKKPGGGGKQDSRGQSRQPAQSGNRR